MKKLPKDYQFWQQRIAQDRFNRNHRKKGSDQKKMGSTLARVWAAWEKRERITIPAEFNFQPENVDRSRYTAIQVSQKIDDNTKILLDFGGVDHMSAMALVYLFSEVDCRLSDENSAEKLVRVTCTGAAPHIKSILRDIGFLYRVGSNEKPSGKMLPVIRGERDDYIGDMVKYVIDKARHEGQITDVQAPEAELVTSRALQEAMLNVQHHAYPNQENSKLWWSTAIIIEQQLFIAICDRGVGIPRTLPNSEFWSWLKHKVNLTSDHELIRQAMVYTRTSTTSRRRASHRGFGSRDMQNLVMSAGKGYMTVVSGKGYYKLLGADSEEHSASIKYDIDGTVIQWCLPLTGGSKWSMKR